MAAGTTEVFSNNGASTLSAAITTTGATSCTVTSAATFPTTGNFRVLIDSEIILVTAVSGTTFTITRGVEGTTAATHLINAPITEIVTAGALKALQTTSPIFTNTASSTYTMDSTGNAFDVEIWHNKSGHVSYVLPTPTAGRRIEWIDVTGAIQTAANWVSFVPSAGETINGSSGFAMSGTAYHFTNGSATVTATSSFFTKELYVGCSIASSNQAGVNYIVSAIGSDTSLTLATNFTGTTTTTATATRTSLQVSANFVRMQIRSDGTNWQINGDGTPTKISFTANGTVVCPAGVTGFDCIGSGGGGSGGVNAGAGGGGGGGAIEVRQLLSPAGNTGYAVTIGAGGAAVSSGAGNPGGTTSLGALGNWIGASGGNGAQTTNGGGCATTANGANQFTNLQVSGPQNDFTPQPQAGGGCNSSAAAAGGDSPQGFHGGTGTATQGGGGGAGGRGPGGNAGSSASANTGAGGGGSATTSGAGGSGYLDIWYVL